MKYPVEKIKDGVRMAGCDCFTAQDLWEYRLHLIHLYACHDGLDMVEEDRIEEEAIDRAYELAMDTLRRN